VLGECHGHLALVGTNRISGLDEFRSRRSR